MIERDYMAAALHAADLSRHATRCHTLEDNDLSLGVWPSLIREDLDNIAEALGLKVVEPDNADLVGTR